MRRVVAAGIVGLGFLVLLSGCTGTTEFGSNVSYVEEWKSDETIVYHIGTEFDTSVVEVNNTSEIELWRRSSLGGNRPLEISNVKFRYPNNSIVNVSSDSVEYASDRTVLKLPGPEGEVAYATRGGNGFFSRPVPLTGSVRVRLPQGTDARNIVLGDISPSGYEVVSESPLVLRWDEVEQRTQVKIRYYSKGDPMLLVYLLAVLLIAAVIVLLYYRRVFSNLREEKSELRK
ncbi:MAG: DUF5803 family protein [Halobacteria archaeon]|nr:DUF5803 family protein [Halobacteria archaeon]